MIKVGTDFSGIGAPEQALTNLGIDFESVFACEIDKYARKSFLAIHKQPKTFYEDITKRDHSEVEQLDLYVAGFPCQAFSMAGQRKGFDDVRGTLFFNVADFIRINQPKCFVLENVKGLVSHDDGKTFQTILSLLSDNGGTVNKQIFIPYFLDGLGYHIYYKVMNTKHHGIPQNRERIFIVGFKDFRDFNFPKDEPLKLKLMDMLQDDPSDKYFLSDKMIESLTYNGRKKGIIGDLNKGGQKGEVFSEDSNFISCLTATDYKQPKQIQVKSANQQGHKIANTLDTACNQGVIEWQQMTEKRTEEAKKIRSENMKKGRDYSPRRSKELTTRNDQLANTVTSTQTKEQYLSNGYKIRRLTPLECWRLQNFPDEQFFKAQQVNSDTQLYKQAGNSITVIVIQKIIKSIFNI